MQNKNQSLTYPAAIILFCFPWLSVALGQTFLVSSPKSCSNHWEVAQKCVNLGSGYESKGQSQKAFKQYEQALNQLQVSFKEYQSSVKQWQNSCKVEKKKVLEQFVRYSNIFDSLAKSFHRVAPNAPITIKAFEYYIKAQEEVIRFNHGKEILIPYINSLISLGISCSHMRSFNKSLSLFWKACRMQMSAKLSAPKISETYRQIATTYEKMNKYELALQNYRESAHRLNQEPAKWFHAATLAEKKGALNEAIQDYGKADLAYKQVLNSDGVAYCRIHEDISIRMLSLHAKKHYKQAKQIEDEGFLIAQNAFQCSQERLLDKATTAYKKGIQQYERAIEEYSLYRKELLANKKFKNSKIFQKVCKKAFREVIESTQNCQMNLAISYYCLGNILACQRHLEEATQFYKTALNIYQKLNLSINNFYFQNGRNAMKNCEKVKEGNRLFNQGVAYGKHGYNAMKNRGNDQQVWQNYQKAIEAFRKAREIYKQGNTKGLYEDFINVSKKNEAAMLRNQGGILMDKQKFKIAVQKYEEAYIFYTDSGYHHLAQQCEMMLANCHYWEGLRVEYEGDIQGAIKEYKEAFEQYIELGVDDWRPQNVAKALDHCIKIEQAKKIYFEAHDLESKGNTEGENGRHMQAMGAYVEGVEKLEKVIKMLQAANRRMYARAEIKNFYEYLIKLCYRNQGAMTYNHGIIWEYLRQYKNAKAKYQESIDYFQASEDIGSEDDEPLINAKKALKQVALQIKKTNQNQLK